MPSYEQASLKLQSISHALSRSHIIHVAVYRRSPSENVIYFVPCPAALSQGDACQTSLRCRRLVESRNIPVYHAASTDLRTRTFENEKPLTHNHTEGVSLFLFDGETLRTRMTLDIRLNDRHSRNHREQSVAWRRRTGEPSRCDFTATQSRHCVGTESRTRPHLHTPRPFNIRLTDAV